MMDLEATWKTNTEDIMKYQNTAEQQQYIPLMKYTYIIVYGLLLLDTTTSSQNLTQRNKYLVQIVNIEKNQQQPSVYI